MKLNPMCLAYRAMARSALCISAFVLVQLGPKTLSQQPPENPLSDGRAAAESSLSATESELRHQLDVNSNAAPILFRLAQVLLRENKPKESLEIYTQASRMQKPNAEQLRLVAMDYVLLKLDNDAIHWLQVARSMDPDNVDVLYDLGRCFYTQARFNEAERAFSEVLRRRPKSIKAEENLGLTLDKEVQPERAEAAMRAAVEWSGQQPADEWPFLNLGTFLLEQSRAGEAVPFLKKAVSTAPANPKCHEKLGRALIQTEEWREGLSELKDAARLDAKNPRIHFELGRAYKSAGQPDKAAAEFELSRSLYGTHSED